ncbi:hypothetical protein I3760_05G213600 [Carya illinoinensis]|nr:hypothetical protein I3760_05G213600 [Carya illinoinensis]
MWIKHLDQLLCCFKMSFGDLEAGGQPRHQQRQQQQDHSQALASGIFQINTAVSSFSRLVNSLGTPKDTLELRDRLHKARLHIAELVRDTSTRLKQASGTDQHLEVSAANKITDAKLAKDFQLVLREFQKVQRLAVEREATYAPFVPKEVLPSRKEVVLMDEIILNGAIIEERVQGIREIQQQMIEVNEIFKDLAVLLHDQDALIGEPYEEIRDIQQQMIKINEIYKDLAVLVHEQDALIDK